MRRTILALVLALAASSSPALAQTPTYSDLTYAVVGSAPLDLDLYLPATGASPYPVLVYIHGGNWWAGSKSPVPGLCSLALAQGMAVASIDYRLTTQAALFAPAPVTFPAQIFDVKGAVRWLRANAATYGLDPTRFASFGGSSGGHLSALLATSGGVAALEGDVGGNASFSSCVQAAVDYLGQTNLLTIQDDITTPPGSVVDHDAASSAESYLLGWFQPGRGLGDIKAHLTDPTPPYPSLVALCVQASPMTWVDPSDPPMFIVHGTEDTYVPTTQSTRLSRALFAAGVQHDFRVLPGVIHNTLDPAINAQAAAFLSEKLIGPNRADVGTPYCAGDGSGAPCPCGNTTLPGANLGCAHSLRTGASLTAVGRASIANDTLVLRGTSMLDSTVLYFQGASLIAGGAGVGFGDGLNCVGVPRRRLGAKANDFGYSQYPVGDDTPVSVRGGATAGATLYYQLWFRDSSAFCTNYTFNFSNALAVTWTP